MQELLNLFFVGLVSVGSYASATVVNGKKRCPNCDQEDECNSENHQYQSQQ